MKNGSSLSGCLQEVFRPRFFFLLMSLAAFVFCSGFLGYCAPVAAISADPIAGAVPLTVHFNASGSTDGDDDIVRYVWDFGDGSNPAEGIEIDHTYNQVGEFTATLTVSDAGDHSSQATVTITTRIITLSITSPYDGEDISKPDVIVKGRVSNFYGYETGVTVNGKAAHVYAGEFVVNHVPLQAGTYTLTAEAVDVQGNMAEATVGINATTPEKYLSFSCDDDIGDMPMESRLTINSSFACVNPSISATFTDSGSLDFLESLGGNAYRARMTAPGLYYFKARAYDDGNNLYTDEVGILVLDRQDLDTSVRAKWDSMRVALAQNDIETAVKDISARTKDAYREAFNTLTTEQRADLSQMLGDIQLIKVKGDVLEYDIQTTVRGRALSFMLLFVRDSDGLWKIRGF
jgi:PKD repeat protein